MKMFCSDITSLTEFTRQFRFQVQEKHINKELDAQPGNYLIFDIPNHQGATSRRCYTVTSVPEKDCYEIIVEDKKKGGSSTQLTELMKNGTLLELIGLGGNITFNLVSKSEHLLLIAGGIGITLPLSLIRSYYHQYGTNNTEKRVTLILCAPNIRLIPCLNELIDLQARCHWFSLKVFITQTTLYRKDETIRGGRPVLADFQSQIAPEIVVICGSTDFASSIQQQIRTLFPTAKIEIEAFTSAFESQAIDHESKLFVHNTQGIYSTSPKQTILDTLLAEGVHIRNMCRAGICGSCKIRVTEGQVKREADFCLTDRDKEEGIALACCTFIKSDLVKIEVI